MTKHNCLIVTGINLFILFFLLTGNLYGQDLSIHISVENLTKSRIIVEGVRRPGLKRWSFENSYAGIVGLGQRIKGFRLSSEDKQSIPVREAATGEYQSDIEATNFSYEVLLNFPSNPAHASHISWLSDRTGILMLHDLLPREDKRLKTAISFHLPQNWSISTSEPKLNRDEYQIRDIDRSIFYVGENLREAYRRIDNLDLIFATNGDWAFKDDEALDIASRIVEKYRKDLRSLPSSVPIVLMMVQYPETGNVVQWSAETRGGTVLFLSKREPSRLAALSKAGVIWAHELFHVWVPNSLKFKGEYDWFYEGFTLYKALLTALEFEWLTFQDYLNAIGRAFDAYKAIENRDSLSLVEASRRRWTDSGTLIYHKGLLVAFLYDLTLRHQTKGRLSLENVYRELFQRYGSSKEEQDGNSAVLGVLNSIGKMAPFTERFIEKRVEIDLEREIAEFGLLLSKGGVRTHLTVVDSLDKTQQDILRKLGYLPIIQRNRREGK
jgi:hypothetical protein